MRTLLALGTVHAGFVLLIVLLFALLGGAAWGWARWRYWSLAPAAVILAIMVTMTATGNGWTP